MGSLLPQEDPLQVQQLWACITVFIIMTYDFESKMGHILQYVLSTICKYYRVIQ